MFPSTTDHDLPASLTAGHGFFIRSLKTVGHQLVDVRFQFRPSGAAADGHQGLEARRRRGAFGLSTMAPRPRP